MVGTAANCKLMTNAIHYIVAGLVVSGHQEGSGKLGMRLLKLNLLFLKVGN